MTAHSPIEVRSRAVGPWPMNTYALVCPDTRESVLFDPGADPETLVEMLAGTRPIAILLTHTHPDHVGALDEMRRRLKVPLARFPKIVAADAACTALAAFDKARPESQADAE